MTIAGRAQVPVPFVFLGALLRVLQPADRGRDALVLAELFELGAGHHHFHVQVRLAHRKLELDHAVGMLFPDAHIALAGIEGIGGGVCLFHAANSRNAPSSAPMNLDIQGKVPKQGRFHLA